jgi:hypothetical protein
VSVLRRLLSDFARITFTGEAERVAWNQLRRGIYISRDLKIVAPIVDLIEF